VGAATTGVGQKPLSGTESVSKPDWNPVDVDSRVSSKHMLDLLKSTNLFDGYSDRELEAMCLELVHERHAAGDVILHEGDIGDRLHVIASGSARVYTLNNEGREIVLARLERGGYFGEQALLTATPLRRNASVGALTHVETVSITHAAFQRYLKANERLRTLLAEIGQKQLMVKITNQLQDQNARHRDIGQLFKQVRNLSEREVIFRQADVPDNAYFLLNGRIEIRFYGEDHRSKSHTFVQPGQFFGELGALDGTPRAGMAVASAESRVAVINSSTLAEFDRENAQLHAFLTSLRALYQVPAIGLVTQHQGDFLGGSAFHTSFQKPNGEVLTVSRLINTNVFSIGYAVNRNIQQEHFQDAEDHAREILLDNHRLVGVISLGAWDDHPDLFKSIYDKVEVPPRGVESFLKTGHLDLRVGATASAGLLCECMHVNKQVIDDLILEGISTPEAISDQTGAGTICGGCRPRIIELTGGNAWTYVTIANIREHNKIIRSYRLQPITGRVAAFSAGQHIVIEGNIEGRWVARSYTLTEVDEVNNYYEITVKKEKHGYFSNWLFSHDTERISLRASQPQGGFILGQDVCTPACCLMAGIGITPAIAFGRQLIASRNQRQLHIDYSVHAKEDVAFERELADWSQKFPNISDHIRITSKHGYLVETEVRTLLNRFADADIYVCGPERYAAAIRATLTAIGVTADKIHLEEFIQAGAPVTGALQVA
jgi:ferredoxin-NADP reductase/CRP-like cAMP-binding protein